jgi:hypothetical protein
LRLRLKTGEETRMEQRTLDRIYFAAIAAAAVATTVLRELGFRLWQIFAIIIPIFLLLMMILIYINPGINPGPKAKPFVERLKRRLR